MHFTSPLFISRAAGIFSAGLGLIVLSGWVFNIVALKSVLPGLISMKPNTAVGFLLSGIALSISPATQFGWIPQRLSRTAAFLLLLLGVITLSQYLFDQDLGVDQLLFRVAPGASFDDLHPARMTPQSALGFSILGSMLLLLRSRQTLAIAQYLTLVFAIVPFIAILGYLLGFDSVPFVPAYKPMAIHTVLGFLVVSTGILAATIDVGVLAKLRKKLPSIIFGFALILLLLCVAATVANWRHMSQVNARHIRTHEIVLRLENIATEIEFNISAYRGFVLTGQEKFIAPLESSRNRLDSNLAEIRQLIGSENQQEKLSKLKYLIKHRIQLCDEKIQLRKDRGLEDGAKAVAAGQGEHLNQQIRTQIDDFIRSETKMVEQLQNQAYTNQKTTLIDLSFTLVTGLGLLVLVMAESRRQANQRKMAETERSRLIAILETTTDFISTADLNNNISYINRAGRALLGLGDRSVAELNIPDVHPNWAYELILEQGIPSAKLYGSWQGETALLAADGREIPVSQVILVHRDEEGNIQFLSTLMRDISELRSAQKALAESEQRYRLQVEYAPEGIVVLDTDSCLFVDANSEALKMFGMSRAEFLRCGLKDVMPLTQSNDRQTMDFASEKIHEALAGGMPIFEFVHVNAAGQPFPTEVRLLRMPSDGRQLIRGSVTDISERKDAEKALRIRDNAIRTSLNAIAMADLQGNLTYVNDSFVALWGYQNAEEILGKSATVFWQDPNKAQAIMVALVNSGRSWRGEFTGLNKKGELFDVDISASLAFDANDKPIAMMASFLDISERKRSEELQRQMLHRLDTIANASPALLWHSGLDKCCDWFNRRWLEFTGRTIEQETGNGWTEGVHPDDLECCLSIYFNAFDARQPFSMEYRLSRHDGEYRWIIDQGLPRYDADGVFVGYIGSCLDISENKQIQAELQRFKTTLDLTQDCVFMFDPLTLKFFFVNKGAFDQVGYTVDEMMDMTPLDIKPEFDETRFRTMIAPMLAGEISGHHFETVHRHKDGHDINVEIALQYVAPANESPRFIAIVRDITQRKLAEQKLIEREAFYRGVIEASSDSFWLFDSNGCLLQVSDNYCQRSGYTQKELTSMSLRDVDATMSPSDIAVRIQKLIEAKQAVFETQHRAKDGSVWPVEVSTVYMPVSGGRFFSFIRDISERKRVEDKLRASEASLKEAQRLAQIGSWELDLIQNQLVWSDEVFRIFEIDPARFAASYEGFLDAVHPDDRAMVNATYTESVNNHSAYNMVHRLLMADGAIKYVRERGKTLYQSNMPVLSIGTVQDITEAKLIEDELLLYRNHLESMVKRRTAELEAVNQELEAFAYSVSHDLRAPLRGIDGFSQALLEDYQDKLDNTGRDYLNRVRASSQRMGDLIDELLKLSRITRAMLKRSRINLSDLALLVLRQLQEAAPEHHVETVVQTGLQVTGDGGLLKVALENLLSNAWKYSAKQASPRLEFGSFEQDGETIYFVSDNGVGFDMQYADKLFGAFQRLHHREQFEGNGIGLATVKRIIHRHGGRIWAESELDKKTTFYFTVPNEDPESGNP